MMATGTLVSVEEYLNTSYSPDCDYVDGEVLERNLGEREHSELQTEDGLLSTSGPDISTSIADLYRSLE